MQKLPRFLLLLSLLVSAACGQSRKIGDVTVVVDKQTIPIRVSANTKDLRDLALLAFSAHGRYDLSGRRTPEYEFKFTGSGNQARIDILKGASIIASEVVTGFSPRQALLKAADLAVVKTNGLGLRGFFTARLAFLSQREGKNEVCTADLFYGEAKQITRDRSLALFPRWTPDGSRIIYTSYFKTGAPDIYLLDPTSNRKDTFVSFRGSNTGARFSPNGQQVAMILTGEGNAEIYISNAQGRQPVRKTKLDALKSSPCWSPDASQLIFAMDPGPQLYVMSVNGGAPRRLSSAFSYMAEPDWSRTEKNKIACTVRVGGRFQIAVVDLATGQAKLVSKAPFDAVEPSWLADGRHLIYTVRDKRSSELAILDTESGNSAQISVNGSKSEQASVWTP